MLRIHRCEGDRLVARTLPSRGSRPDARPAETTGPVWLDLFNPTPEEDACVEQALGISLPSREEMQEIEMSARLYNEGGAEFMTVTAIAMLDSDEPVTTPITFVLKGASLATIRYAEPLAFRSVVARAQRPGRGGLRHRRAGDAEPDRGPDRPHGRHAGARRGRYRCDLAQRVPPQVEERAAQQAAATLPPPSSRSAATATSSPSCARAWSASIGSSATTRPPRPTTSGR